MPDTRVQFGQVRMSFRNGGGHEHRASTISRLTFDHVHQMLDAHRPRLPAAVVDHLRVGPVRVSLAGMDDEEIARASAAEIYRALTEAV
jgi:hypothetical protein